MMMTAEQAVVGAGGPTVVATRGSVCPQRDQLFCCRSVCATSWRRGIWRGSCSVWSRRWIPVRSIVVQVAVRGVRCMSRR